MHGAGGLTAGAIFAGDYRIVRPLAAGGMGAVYVALQLSTDRERALKVMLGELANHDDLRRRFAQEAKVGAQIDSEHVVEVVAAGIDTATGAPWLAMELLQGQDLSSYLDKEGPLAPAVVLELFEQFTHAVGAAHRQGIVHRDLKPENLFLAQTRRAGAPFMLKVLDFGIAKLLGQARTSATAAMGTPLWMSPEQTQSGARITPAADVWAMGLIAFRALAGRPFWRAAGHEEASAMMILREVAFEPIPPASQRSREVGGAELPPAFDAWFARCVTREVAARFADANEMFAELARVLSGAAAPSIARAVASSSPQKTVAAAPLETLAKPVPPVVTDFNAGSSRRLSSTPASRGSRTWVVGAALGTAAVLAVIVLAATGAFSSSARTTAQDDQPASTAKTAQASTAASTSPSAVSVPPPPSASSSSAEPTCEEARKRYADEGLQLAPGSGTSKNASTLNASARVLSDCAVPESMAVTLCVAVRNGKAEGITVKTVPDDPTIASCLRASVAKLPFESTPQMDVLTTTFSPVAKASPQPVTPAPPPPAKKRPPSYNPGGI